MELIGPSDALMEMLRTTSTYVKTPLALNHGKWETGPISLVFTRNGCYQGGAAPLYEPKTWSSDDRNGQMNTYWIKAVGVGRTEVGLAWVQLQCDILI